MTKFLNHSWKLALVSVLFLLISNNGNSQTDNDTVVKQYSSFYDMDTSHSARKATIYSAILPGLGQAYNRKYWKIPLVYGAIGGCLTAALINNKNYQITRTELLLRVNCPSAAGNVDFQFYENSQLLALSNEYSKWRDNMFIFTGVAYALNIVDANVDAHLFNFDVSEDLSLNWQPYTYSWEIRKPVAGLSLTLNFK